MRKANKIKGKICMKNLMMMLHSALKKENENWKPIHYTESKNENEVGSAERNAKIEWFLKINDHFKCNPETVVLCIAIFDYFMSVVKVKSKYAECIAVSCYFLAVKTTEEDELIPTTAELVTGTQCSCSVSDVLRMEKIILQKLNWNSKLVNSLDFLHIMHGLLLLNHTTLTWSPGRQLSSLTRKLHACLTSHHMLMFKPSTISLALLSLELQLCTRDWLALTIMMQHLIKLENGDLIHCREMISETLSVKMPIIKTPELAPNKTTKRCSSPINKPSKRKVEQIEVDDIYDSIKKLYGDDVQATCSTQADHLTQPFRVTSPGFLQISAT